MSHIEFQSLTWLLPVCLPLFTLLGLFLVKRLCLGRGLALAQAGPGKLHTIIIKSLNLPLNLIIVMACILMAEYLFRQAGWLNDSTDSATKISIQLLLIVACLVFIDRLGSGLLNRYRDSSGLLKNSNGIARGLLHGLVYGIGILVILGTLGISITPIIASLGITSLAVALALQPTLENFFSGLQLVMDKPIRIGDFIELDSGEQGFVEKIGWRSTWIKMLPNNLVIMPNSVLAQSKIINYYYPEKELSVPVEVGVHYNSDLEHVERVALDVAREILVSHKWGVDDYDTFVVFHTFDSSSINFTVMLRAKEYFNRFFIKSAYIKALHKRFAQEGIVIPYPIRAINTSQEAAVVSRAP